jgi:CubicO group peptidase (beta-lactamase class C family)
MRIRARAVAAVCMSLLVTGGGSAFAHHLSTVGRPEDAGFSSERLARLTRVFQAEIETGKLPGAVILLARDGKVAYFQPLGFQDREKQTPMARDAIFRIASMTKPLVSVAFMTLVEEGKVQLSDPVSLYLPEMKTVKVGVEKKNETSGQAELTRETPRRDMTIHDLLRHTSGLTYGQFGDSLVKRAYRDANVLDPRQTLAEFVTKLSKLPLAYHPGTTFEYSVSTDVLGRVVEVVSGTTLDTFLAERITKPLHMPDTSFHTRDGQSARVAEPQVESATGKRPPMRDVTARPILLSGGGGMVSTVPDYFRFAQMLLDGGQLDGTRILSPTTVAFMTADHLPPGTAMSPVSMGMGALMPSPEQGQGFGLGFAVRTEVGHNSLPGSPGEFYWVGATGTSFWVDPKERLVAILMIQVPLARTRYYRGLIRNLAYQALLR